MPSTARQLRQPPTIEAIGRVPYFADVCTNLMVQVSRIKGHEIRIVSYAHLDSGDCLLYLSRLRSLYTDASP